MDLSSVAREVKEKCQGHVGKLCMADARMIQAGDHIGVSFRLSTLGPRYSYPTLCMSSTLSAHQNSAPIRYEFIVGLLIEMEPLGQRPQAIGKSCLLIAEQWTDSYVVVLLRVRFPPSPTIRHDCSLMGMGEG